MIICAGLGFGKGQYDKPMSLVLEPYSTNIAHSAFDYLVLGDKISIEPVKLTSFINASALLRVNGQIIDLIEPEKNLNANSIFVLSTIFNTFTNIEDLKPANVGSFESFLRNPKGGKRNIAG